MEPKQIEIDFLKLLKNSGGLVNTLIITGIIIFILIFSYNTFFYYVKPDEYGIKQVKIGIFSKKGLQKKFYKSGLHFIIPFGFEKMYSFPRSLNVLNLGKNNDNQKSYKAIRIKTSDGFFVDVDVTILYKIYNPYKVIKTLGTGKQYIYNGIVPKAGPILRNALGKLTVEQFYNSKLRVKYMKQAEYNLNQDLEKKGLRIFKVLIRYFRYSNEIQKNIEDKKLKDQLVKKNEAEANAALVLAQLKKTIQEGKANVSVKLSEGQAYIVTKNSEAELYQRKKIADADLLINMAKAKAIELKNNALKGYGSDILVALEMAKVFKGIKAVVLPSTGKNGINPLNLNSLLNLSGIKSSKKGGK